MKGRKRELDELRREVEGLRRAVELGADEVTYQTQRAEIAEARVRGAERTLERVRTIVAPSQEPARLRHGVAWVNPSPPKPL